MNNFTGDSDYMSGPYTVNFPAGVTNASFPISLMNDLTLENNEDFILIINSSSLPDYVSKIGQATVTIADDDSKSSCVIVHIVQTSIHNYISKFLSSLVS